MQPTQTNICSSQLQPPLQSKPNFFVSNLYPIHDPFDRSIPILQNMINDFVRDQMKLEYFNGVFYNPFSENKIKHEGDEYKILYGFHLLCLSIQGHPVLSVTPRILLLSSFSSSFLLLPLSKLKSLLLGKYIKTTFPSGRNYYKIDDIIAPTATFLEQLYIQLQIKTKIVPIFSYPSCSFPVLKLEGEGMLPLEYCWRLWEEDSILGGLKKAALPKMDKVIHLLRKSLKNLIQTPTFSQLGLSVDPNPIKFPLLLLPPPILHLSLSVVKSLGAAINSNTVSSFNEKFQSLSISENYLTFPNFQRWTFVVSKVDFELAQCFLDETQKIFKKNGLPAKNPEIIVFEDNYPNEQFDSKGSAVDSESWMAKIFPVDYLPALPSSLLAIVIVPSYLPPFSSFYSGIKLGLTYLGVPSQFLQTKTIQTSLANGTLGGLAERIINQIIAKTGYVPWRLDNAGILRTPTMVISIREEETFGKKKGEKRKIFSSVASMNKDFTKYWSSFLISTSSSAISSLLCSLIFESLEKFISILGIQPTQILLFLDLRSPPPPNFLLALEEEFCKTERNSILHPKLISLLLLTHPSSSFLLPTPPVGGFTRRENEIVGYLGREDGKWVRGLAWEILGGIEGIEEGLMQLTFLNFNLNGTSDYPAPMNYSWRLGKFLKMALEEWEGEEEEILERMKRMADVGKLYFL